MEIAITAVVAVLLGAVVAWLARGTTVSRRSEEDTDEAVKEARREAEGVRKEVEARAEREAQTVGREIALKARGDAEAELSERRAEIARIEERILQKQESLDVKLADLDRRLQGLNDRERNLDKEQRELKERKSLLRDELQRVAHLTTAQARQAVLEQAERDARHDQAVIVRKVEEETKRKADHAARNLLSIAMARLAGGHAAETTTSVVVLPSDEMKGRIIGREGRNIRALENLTGVDFIIDDTPSAVILSAFDGVRREIARMTLDKLVKDGRIQPARIEEMYYKSRSEIENHIAEVGEQATFEANVASVHPELAKLLGRLKFRTSYGQNVLAHSIECARLAGLMADELGASVETARRGALLHDIGKAVSHEVEGPHALVGGKVARRYKEPEAVAHAIESHHNEVQPQTVEAVVVQAADALSGARPGARGESLEQYFERLRSIEDICGRRPGVDRVFAMQAGRDVRIMVKPEDVTDDESTVLAREIAHDVERELDFPGQIKVTVIRESRAMAFAEKTAASRG